MTRVGMMDKKTTGPMMNGARKKGGAKKKSGDLTSMSGYLLYTR